MTARKDGGPAFPVEMMNATKRNVVSEGQVVPPGTFVQLTGMSLRDYFAAKAMAALVTTDSWSIEVADGGDAQPEHVAAEAYAIADAMLKARQA